MPATELDIALSHPFSKDILSTAAYIDGAAASRREKIKHTKCDSIPTATRRVCTNSNPFGI